jgi:hypothetical protein
MKNVTGFLAEDGTFFKTSAECKRYEARRIIEEYCQYNSIKSVTKMMETLEALADPIMDYLNADHEVKEQEKLDQVKENTGGAGGDQADD